MCLLKDTKRIFSVLGNRRQPCTSIHVLPVPGPALTTTWVLPFSRHFQTGSCSMVPGIRGMGSNFRSPLTVGTRMVRGLVGSEPIERVPRHLGNLAQPQKGPEADRRSTIGISQSGQR